MTTYPVKSYTINIGGVNYPFTTNLKGIAEININLSSIETTSTISYTVGGLIKQLGNIRYDITAPTVVNVLTRNVSNANSINPWIRGGDRINFEVESSERVVVNFVSIENVT